MRNPFKAIREARLRDEIRNMERYAALCVSARTFQEADANVRLGHGSEEQLRVSASMFHIMLTEYKRDVPKNIQERLNAEGAYRTGIAQAEKSVEAFLS